MMTGPAIFAALKGAVAAIAGGQVTAIDPGTGGARYTIAPTVALSAPPSGGTQATATATVTNGQLSFVITNPGAGYLAAPIVTVTGGDGVGYNTGPLVANTDGLTFRIQPALSPQNSLYPRIVYAGEESDIDQTYDGPSGLAFDLVHVIVLAQDQDARQAIAATVLKDLNGRRREQWGGMWIQGVFYQASTQSDDVLPGLEQDGLIFQDDLEFKIAFDLPT